MKNRQEWLGERKNYIGGSDLGAICGLSPYMYRPAIIKHNSSNQGNFCPELVTL
jgi:predicted phage-related endonuclease